jgi:hypothetical protein
MRLLNRKRQTLSEQWVVRRLVGGRPHEYLRLTKGGYRWTKKSHLATRFASQSYAHREVQWTELAWHNGVGFYKL